MMTLLFLAGTPPDQLTQQIMAQVIQGRCTVLVVLGAQSELWGLWHLAAQTRSTMDLVLSTTLLTRLTGLALATQVSSGEMGAILAHKY